MKNVLNRNQILSVVTVVKNDAKGLAKTLNSLYLSNCDFQSIIMDGSDNLDCREVAKPFLVDSRFSYFMQKSQGIYQAMNEAKAQANGQYCLFLNAGDVIANLKVLPEICDLLSNRSELICTYILEHYQGDFFLRPKRGDILSIKNVGHCGTFYPRDYYQRNHYDLNFPIAADGYYTKQAVNSHGFLFFPMVVAIFDLGGVSTSYEKPIVFSNYSVKKKCQILIKFVLWQMLSHRSFYRVLNFHKRDRFRQDQLDNLFRAFDTN